jgi:hypothetical protein
MEDAESPPSGHPPIEEPVLASNPSPTSSRPVRMDGSSRESQKQSFGDLSQIYMTADSDEARTLSYVAPSQETLKSIVDAISGLGNENEPHWVGHGFSENDVAGRDADGMRGVVSPLPGRILGGPSERRRIGEYTG